MAAGATRPGRVRSNVLSTTRASSCVRAAPRHNGEPSDFQWVSMLGGQVLWDRVKCINVHDVGERIRIPPRWGRDAQKERDEGKGRLGSADDMLAGMTLFGPYIISKFSVSLRRHWREEVQIHLAPGTPSQDWGGARTRGKDLPVNCVHTAQYFITALPERPAGPRCAHSDSKGNHGDSQGNNQQPTREGCVGLHPTCC